MNFENAVEKAEEQLGHLANQNADTPMLRAIGYAILALAISVKELSKSSAHKGGGNE